MSQDTGMAPPSKSKARAIRGFDDAITQNVPERVCKVCDGCSIPHTGVPKAEHRSRETWKTGVKFTTFVPGSVAWRLRLRRAMFETLRQDRRFAERGHP